MAPEARSSIASRTGGARTNLVAIGLLGCVLQQESIAIHSEDYQVSRSEMVISLLAANGCGNK